ncbi:hypothetical protein HS088_TW02G01102 [Tripterygium wilfordii]|uniref:cAMP-regulated phosphoprotein 19-related protein n=1 Tax=Tripterygium wilfordii TaxID=458696 RepID=A0A7J7E098_TRIWF|nr:uncharacterized protein LOC120016431 [Tripterygium wilfordii]KAF5752082.1 hypothetical protein HS088_TW02G01102 [Tripterygium wilfordii]
MSSAKFEDVKQELSEEVAPKNQVSEENPVEELEDLDKNGDNSVPSPQQEEEIIKKKYGGMLPKKPPLISKDHERAFFDSADWALGKQGTQKPKGPLEALRPKLQPTPHQQLRSRHSAYTHTGDDGDIDVDGDDNESAEVQSCTKNDGNGKSNASEDQSVQGSAVC